MKTFTFAQLKKMIPEQGYKFASLENSQGERIQLNNTVKTKINAQLDLLQKRLNSELYPDGYYFVCMAQTIARAKNPDKYAVVKGKPSKEDLSENKKDLPAIKQPVEVLTYDAALKMQQTISDQKAEISMLKLEIEMLQQEIADLESANKETDLDEGEEKKSGVKTFIEEAMPSITGIMDKYFATEERKLDIKEKELGLKGKQMAKANMKRTLVKPGSPEHIALIHSLHKKDTDESLNKLDSELDKLEAANAELYIKVCTDLGIEFENGEEEQK